MHLPFVKFQGTGNDFVLIDNRADHWGGQLPSTEWVAHCCHRRFGIGADGLILLQQREGYDFEMIYYNADGGLGSMCGNGGRCTVAFARQLGIIGDRTRFLASDGEHEAVLRDTGVIELKMQSVRGFERLDTNAYFLNTGSPHYVEIVEDLAAVDVLARGRAIRYNERFRAQGTNVNFVQLESDSAIAVATYERGVEDETYSCGTGAVASALITAVLRGTTGAGDIAICTKGGTLAVRFLRSGEDRFEDIWLCGPAVAVFGGLVEMRGGE